MSVDRKDPNARTSTIDIKKSVERTIEEVIRDAAEGLVSFVAEQRSSEIVSEYIETMPRLLDEIKMSEIVLKTGKFIDIEKLELPKDLVPKKAAPKKKPRKPPCKSQFDQEILKVWEYLQRNRGAVMSEHSESIKMGPPVEVMERMIFDYLVQSNEIPAKEVPQKK